MERKRVEIMIDSGAYSIHTGRAPKGLGFDTYAEFIKEQIAEQFEYIDDIEFINFDEIGNAKGSYINWKKLLKVYDKVIPVFHVGTDIKYLERYLKDGAQYVCIGAITSLSTRARIYGLDMVWDKYLSKYPVKVHGLGLTSVNLINRYPWYSLDSTKVMKLSAYGKILLPKIVSNGSELFDWSDVKSYNISLVRRHAVDTVTSLFSLPPKVYNIYIDELIKKFGFHIERKSHYTKKISKYNPIVDLDMNLEHESDTTNEKTLFSFQNRILFNFMVWNMYSKTVDKKLYSAVYDIRSIKGAFDILDLPRFLFSFAYRTSYDRFKQFLKEEYSDEKRKSKENQKVK